MELETIKNKIYEIRGQQVMLDFDLAELYQVSTSALNQSVKRNAKRFPPDFMFQITQETRVRDNILKSKEQKNIQPTKGGHKMVTCQNYVSLFYRQITSCPSDGGIS